MATPSDFPLSPPDDKSPIPEVVTTPSPTPPTTEAQQASIAQETPKQQDSPPSVFKNSEPLREDQIQNAIKFLSHPRVRGSPVIHRRSFLERKGLTKEEIDEAFRRVPDPSPSSHHHFLISQKMALSLLSVFVFLQVFTHIVFAASNEESKISVPPSPSYKPSPPLVKPPTLPTTPIKPPTTTPPVKSPATPVTPTKPPVKSYPPQVKPPTSPLVKPPTYKPPTPAVKPPTKPPVQPPTYKPPTPLVKPPTIPPVKPPTAPVKPTPVTTPPPVKPPVNPIPSPPVNAPPVKPPTPPAKPPTPPPVRTRLDCVPLCGTRCGQHSRQNVCMRACVTCCYRCKCVPPGTYGNKEKCGSCYANMKTRGGRPKCP